MKKAIAILMILLISNNALAFDALRKWISPKSYWQKKVTESEEAVHFYRSDLHSCQLDITKLQRTRDITIKQNVLLGMTPREAQEDFVIEYQETVETCKAIREVLQESQKDLEHAKDELKKVQ